VWAEVEFDYSDTGALWPRDCVEKVESTLFSPAGGRKSRAPRSPP